MIDSNELARARLAAIAARMPTEAPLDTPERLYAAAIETHVRVRDGNRTVTRVKADFMHLHARDRHDAAAKLFAASVSGAFPKNTRLIPDGLAEAVGFLVNDDDDNGENGLV